MSADITAWQTQLRKGVAECVVLSLLEVEERYGLDILRRATSSIGVLSEGTLYPLLTRLEREGKIVGRWVVDTKTRNSRKYYRLSNDGAALLVEMKAVWADFASFVTAVVAVGSFVEDQAYEFDHHANARSV